MGKTIHGKQCTITWYVDNLKVSHVESPVVDIVIINSYFKNMSVTRGTKHKYVGIEIELTHNGKVALFRKENLLKFIKTFGEDLTTPAASPVQKGLF